MSAKGLLQIYERVSSLLILSSREFIQDMDFNKVKEVEIAMSALVRISIPVNNHNHHFILNNHEIISFHTKLTLGCNHP